jgi:hypothetical protein
VHNIKMGDVAVAEGYRPTFGQSPFALARGETFERNLLWDGAQDLIAQLVLHGILPDGATGLADLRLAMNGGKLGSLEAAIEVTKTLVADIANGEDPAKLPAVIAGATIRIPRGVMLPEAILIVDLVTVRSDGAPRELVVGEVKTYADRGGHTDRQSLAVARAQAGLYVHALELLLDELDLSDRLRVRHDGFLVLSRPGSNRPSIRAREDLRYQAERARRGFELLEAAAQGLPPFVPVRDDPIAAVRSSGTDFSDACLTFCDRAKKCHADALEAGNPAVLGDDVARFVGAVSLDRALALVRGEPPAGDAEVDLARRIAESERVVAP